MISEGWLFLLSVLLCGILGYVIRIADRLREIGHRLGAIRVACQDSAEVLMCENAQQIPVLLRAIRRGVNRLKP